MRGIRTTVAELLICLCCAADSTKQLAEARCDIAAGKYQEALKLLKELEAKSPNDADVLYLEATLHMKAFNDATFAMFQRTPSSYRVHELSAEILEMQNRYTDAVDEYKKAIAGNPSAADLHYRLGRALLLESHSPEALKNAAAAFNAELQLNPEDSASQFQLGQIALVEGNAEEARTRLRKALALTPDFVAALIALGKLDLQQKRYSDAIAHLSQAANRQPANEAAHYALMTAYRDSGDMEKAKAEKATLDRLQKPPEGEFSDFLKKLGEKQPAQ